eukprot:CAMPEP_0179013428 /NCGR_PEP_ID=MMETSP0796-20121207/1720_1 /TAXON_ID=73915 /ORGANISM="Pyrodinium bahamense, Strain pbaha01" /LENGTH=444 /DNA_ID=CAMNT_0020708929 /DNA_START=46 /DNA_END=1380 /DNA_ORIENTATION=-
MAASRSGGQPARGIGGTGGGASGQQSWWSMGSRGQLGPGALLVGGACALLGTFCACALCAYLTILIQHGGARACSGSVGERVEFQSSMRRPRVDREPIMYGRVKEKTIWAYWYHPEDCPSSKRCVLPPLIQLCTETVRRNRGSFDYKIIHWDDIDKYVTRSEMPIHFRSMRPAIQKDALMNALLGRYGGVALDISSILLRPLDEYWDEMVTTGATFRGYMYRYNGMEWGNSENAAVWFLMARREGIFSSAVRHQVIGMGDYKLPPCKQQGGYHNPYFAMGDQTLTPILSMFNYSLPQCIRDPTVGPPWSWKDMCPEYEFPRYNDRMPGPPRNDAKIMLREPREGPQLPFSFTDDFSMGAWHVSSSELVNCTGRWPCKTQQECWEKVFIPRYHARAGPGESRLLEFVKLFNSGGRLKKLTREELLSDRDTFLFHWLTLAGVSGLT